ncbi:MAG: hypothetical protein NAG76_03890 [Candidatus Pristimantibacillus lignocellulolyticus]|uniref:Peptidase M10 metallopeptidase domain-containing protein n=1 Tax=Candidatus Pristimantibacillus lignocellulolyticus TaxID=2994561 RepID=A0A9J6ZGU7_9BACL|nr:MAG: hypothetical protein NAG76_03890 [Candidatus Pristimantibacillus lignocellulolyticus]
MKYGKVLLCIVPLIIASYLGVKTAEGHTSTDIYSGNWATTVANNLAVAVAPSAQGYFLRIENAAAAWNGIEDALVFKAPHKSDEAETNHVSRVHVRGVDLGATGAYADAGNYKYSIIFGYTLDWSAEWKDSIVRLNTNSSTTGNGLKNLTYSQIQETITHEFGHVAALKHNALTSEDSNAIMRQYGFNDTAVPLSHDIAMIKHKY